VAIGAWMVTLNCSLFIGWKIGNLTFARLLNANLTVDSLKVNYNIDRLETYISTGRCRKKALVHIRRWLLFYPDLVTRFSVTRFFVTRFLVTDLLWIIGLKMKAA
jgi:hypothetical protein